MTEIEAKALALVNEIAVKRGGSPVDFYGLEGDIIATAHRQAAYERAAKLCEALAESTYETAEARDAALGCAQFILAMQ